MKRPVYIYIYIYIYIHSLSLFRSLASDQFTAMQTESSISPQKGIFLFSVLPPENVYSSRTKIKSKSKIHLHG
jgi:hypothetical protein